MNPTKSRSQLCVMRSVNTLLRSGTLRISCRSSSWSTKRLRNSTRSFSKRNKLRRNSCKNYSKSQDQRHLASPTTRGFELISEPLASYGSCYTKEYACCDNVTTSSIAASRWMTFAVLNIYSMIKIIDKSNLFFSKYSSKCYSVSLLYCRVQSFMCRCTRHDHVSSPFS